MSKRIAVVGSGIGGLTSALLLSHRGYEVTVYERSDRLGGRIAYESDGHYQIDQGPTIVLLPEVIHEILEQAGMSRESLRFIPCDPLYRIHYADGRIMTKYRDTEHQAEELERIFPGEAAGFRRFMADMSELFPAGRASILEQDFPSYRSFFTRERLSLLRRLKAYKSMRGVIGDYFRTEQLKDAYSLQSLYIGGAPFSTPGIYSLLPYAEHAYGVWMLEGGYAALPAILGEELKRRGVTFRLHAEVQSLSVVDGVCRGLTSGSELEAYDGVLYNGDFPNIHNLLDAGTLPAKRRFRPSSGCVLLYVGANRRWEKMLTHQFFLPQSLQANLKQVFRHSQLPEDPSFYVFNPAALDSNAAPAGESVLYFLIPVPNSTDMFWEEGAEALAERVIASADERGFDGLRQSVKWLKIRTPLEAERDGLYGGGSFGIAPVLWQSGVYRPQPRPFPIRRLAAAGASVHPGGGVPIVMQGARMAVNQLIKELE